MIEFANSISSGLLDSLTSISLILLVLVRISLFKYLSLTVTINNEVYCCIPLFSVSKEVCGAKASTLKECSSDTYEGGLPSSNPAPILLKLEVKSLSIPTL